jgi:hypothetical protein
MVDSAADDNTAQYRYVEDNDALDTVVDGTLACLAPARPDHGSDQARVLSDETHERAYLAWEAARRAIHDQWMIATDPANLVPAVPRTMREAAALLREHPLPDLTQAEAVAIRRELGLQPAPAPEPLPVITEDDIHLVCRLALTPE